MIDYLIYILAFVIGSVAGLLYSYSKHSEPFVAVNDINTVALVVSAIGWILAIDLGNVILAGLGFLLVGFVMGERPGYGRKETLIGFVVGILIYLILQWTV